MIQVYSMTRKDSANEHSDSRTIGSARLGSSSYSTVPIDVFAIVQGCGIAVHMLELEESVSGMLVIKGNKAAIGINSGNHMHDSDYPCT